MSELQKQNKYYIFCDVAKSLVRRGKIVQTFAILPFANVGDALRVMRGDWRVPMANVAMLLLAAALLVLAIVVLCQIVL